MLFSTININGCGRWQKIRLIFNAIGSSNFGTISAGTRPSCSNILVLKCCGCIHPITSSHLQGAYKFVAAMDEVIRQLPVEEPTHKEGDEKLLVLATQIVAGGRHYDFKLSAWHQMTGDKCHFDIRSVPTSEKHKEQQVHFPLWALPWLRQQMVTNLAEHDGSERIDEMPTMPEWAKQDAPKIGQQEQQSAPAT